MGRLLLSGPMKQAGLSSTKRKPAFIPSTRVEAGFLLLLFFSLKRKEEKVFLWYFLFPGKRKYVSPSAAGHQRPSSAGKGKLRAGGGQENRVAGGEVQTAALPG